jgi:hypothetical protein
MNTVMRTLRRDRVPRIDASLPTRPPETTMDFPRTIEQVTTAWLTDILGAPVTGHEVKFLEGGNLSDAFRLHSITYASPVPSAPSSLVLKFPHSIQASRENAISAGAYLKEARFFRDIAPTLALRTPKLYTVQTDGSPTAAQFVIAMEDLGVHSRVFDQVDDPPTEGFVRKMVLDVASMHAQYWDATILQEDWLSRTDGRYVPSVASWSLQSPMHAAPFREAWARVYGEDPFEDSQWREVEQLHDLLTGPRCTVIHEAIFDLLSSRPRTLIHGDMRADNLFRTDPAAGIDEDASTLTYIDWQLVSAGPPGPEFTEAWMHSLPPELRMHDVDFLRAYHDRLVQLQPAAAAYSYDDLLDDYALSLCFWWSALVTLGNGLLPSFETPEGARGKQLWHVGRRRSFAAMRDHGCLQRIQRLINDVDRQPSRDTLP